MRWGRRKLAETATHAVKVYRPSRRRMRRTASSPPRATWPTPCRGPSIDSDSATQPQLPRTTSSVGSTTVRSVASEPSSDATRASTATSPKRLPDWRIVVSGGLKYRVRGDVVKARHEDVLRHTQSLRVQGVDNANGGLVVGAREDLRGVARRVGAERAWRPRRRPTSNRLRAGQRRVNAHPVFLTPP